MYIHLLIYIVRLTLVLVSSNCHLFLFLPLSLSLTHFPILDQRSPMIPALANRRSRQRSPMIAALVTRQSRSAPIQQVIDQDLHVAVDLEVELWQHADRRARLPYARIRRLRVPLNWCFSGWFLLFCWCLCGWVRLLGRW